MDLRVLVWSGLFVQRKGEESDFFYLVIYRSRRADCGWEHSFLDKSRHKSSPTSGVWFRGNFIMDGG